MTWEIVFEDSFEGGFYDKDGIGELTCPNGWEPAWEDGPQSSQGYLVRPEYDAEDLEGGDSRVKSGRYGAKIAAASATINAVLHRRIAVEPGMNLEATAFVQYYTHHPDGSEAGLAMQVGIDPHGGADFLSDEVVWGEWHGQDDPDDWDGTTWRLVAVQATAASANVTVFLHAANRWRSRTSAAFFDDVQVKGEGGGGTSPPPSGALEEMVAEIAESVDRIDEAVREIADFHREVRERFDF